MIKGRLLAIVGRSVVGALFLGTAFSAVNCETPPARHTWNERWGPIVPHTQYPGDCEDCHENRRWDKVREEFTFDHEKETGHKLEGAHAFAVCLRCHNDRGPVREFAARGCGGCHVTPHKNALGLDCTRCHNQMSWRPVGLVAEHARTRLPLYGAHAAAPCERCHAQAPVGDFRGAPVLCELCHTTDLASVTAPDHQAQGWVHDCGRCHTPMSWTRDHFAHGGFRLVGGHSGLECIRCHTSGSFGPIPSACSSCHMSSYTAAANHVAMSYPTNCAQCHSINGWLPSTFNHRFPRTGRHSVACNQCHTTGNVATFNCLGCHNNQAQLNSQHAERAGYSYTSSACYRCHPSGDAD